MITGVRGSGKTVLMTHIANTLRKEQDWIVIELNSSGDLLKDLAAKPSRLGFFRQSFLRFQDKAMSFSHSLGNCLTK